MSWKPLGSIPPTELVEARLTLHWAAQTLAAVGAAHVTHQTDDSHRNLGWSDQLQALVGQATNSGLHAGLGIDPLTLLVLDDGGQRLEENPVGGGTLEAGFTWMEKMLPKHGGASVGLERPTYDLPDHPVAQEAPFPMHDDGHAELAKWYSNAALVLNQVRREHSGASDVRTWPHHFDIATLITLETGDDPESSKSVGVGMTPGDGGIPEPYWYVTPWPVPQDPQPAQLPHGNWQREGWFGAVLTGTETVAAGVDQENVVASFLSAAIAANQSLVEERS